MVQQGLSLPQEAAWGAKSQTECAKAPKAAPEPQHHGGSCPHKWPQVPHEPFLQFHGALLEEREGCAGARPLLCEDVLWVRAGHGKGWAGGIGWRSFTSSSCAPHNGSVGLVTNISLSPGLLEQDIQGAGMSCPSVTGAESRKCLQVGEGAEMCSPSPLTHPAR